MRYKILTVDDSKTVRIIVRKAFRGYDCEILEANNGVEGLAVAAKESPNLILLDVTMPVMDGVEMLTKLKADPALKAIPVIMLTAEGGRDNVLKIAKIGVRDYLVKPFKEEVLIEKASRVVDLKPIAEAPAKAKSIFDPADILLVEDKPAIMQQIQEGLKHTPWKVHGVATQADATEFCARTTPDLVIVSLSLADDFAFTLLRQMRTNAKTKTTPVFALVVKTDVQQQQQAQSVGFNAIITKPLDLGDIETKMAKAMHLDTSLRYYALEGDTMILRLPENCTNMALAEASNYLKPKLTEAVDAGLSKLVIDLHALKALHIGIIKVLLQAMKTSQDLGMHFALVGNPQFIQECAAFEDTRGWIFSATLEEAKASLLKNSGQGAQLAAT
jgi:two-component system cell cycle response regulator